MASRSEKLRRRQHRKEKKRKQRWPLAEARNAGAAVVFNPRGEAKMSEVLWAFVEPERAQLADEEEDLEKLLTLAVVAWNASLLEGGERAALLDSFVQTVPPQIGHDLRQLVEPLIRRKAKQFPHIRRPIISFKLTRTPDGEPYLYVVSGLN